MLVLVGLVFWLGGRLGLGRLPGDISVSRGNFRFYAPSARAFCCRLCSLWC